MIDRHTYIYIYIYYFIPTVPCCVEEGKIGGFGLLARFVEVRIAVVVVVKTCLACGAFGKKFLTVDNNTHTVITKRG